MLQLGKCAKDNSKIFLLNTKVSNMLFVNIKFDWNFLSHPNKILKFKLKIQQQKTFNKKDAEISLDVPNILLFMKNHLQCDKNEKNIKFQAIWIKV